jgi:hypothetical protein
VQIAIGKREEHLETVRFQRDRTGGLPIRHGRQSIPIGINMPLDGD